MPTQEVEEIHPGQQKVKEGWEQSFPESPMGPDLLVSLDTGASMGLGLGFLDDKCEPILLPRMYESHKFGNLSPRTQEESPGETGAYENCLHVQITNPGARQCEVWVLGHSS